MNTSLVTKRILLLAGVLSGLGATSCFRGYDLSKVKCTHDRDCPKEYPLCGSKNVCVKDSPTDAGAGGKNAASGSRGAGGSGGGRSSSSGESGGRSGSGGSDIDAPFIGVTGGNVGGESGGETTGGVIASGGTEQGGSNTTPGAIACTSNDECANGLCFDGFCCDKECGGCSACAKSMTGEPDGTCASVTGGDDPHEMCTDETATKPCGNDGTCDGKGACRNVGQGQECGAASCGDGKIFTPKPQCDGQGACVPGDPEDCAPYDCAVATGCRRTCSKQEDCNTSTSYCDLSLKLCVPKKTNGKPAIDTFECQSKIVADGVCCDKECSGCYACTSDKNGQLPITTGSCMYVTVAKAADPHGMCPASSDPCGMNGTCNGAGACSYKAEVGDDCGTASCDVDTSMLTKKSCSGAHVCMPGSASACPGLRACASGSACKTGACTADGDCAANNFCLSGTCTPKYPDGHSCTAGANSQCQKNNCVGTTCCSTPCAGECYTCANSTGTCKQLSAGSPCGTGVCNSNGACSACNANVPCTLTGSAEECYNHATSCDSGSSQCVRTTPLSNGTLCGASATCSGSQSIGHWTCQSGTCTKPSPTPCTYTCNTSTGTCAGECNPSSTKCYSSSQYQSCSSSYTWGNPLNCGTGQTCTGNSCACAPNTCGSSCRTCVSPTPYCVGEVCGQCRDVTDCGTGYYACNTSTHKCSCRIPSSNNKIVNGGFDGGDTGWINAGATYNSAIDADRCVASGSLEFDNASPYAKFSQCFSVGANVSYRFGLRYQGAPTCVLTFHSIAGCSTSYQIGDSVDGIRLPDSTIPNWTESTPKLGTTPAGTVSVNLDCLTNGWGGFVAYDQIYFNTGGGGF